MENGQPTSENGQFGVRGRRPKTLKGSDIAIRHFFGTIRVPDSRDSAIPRIRINFSSMLKNYFKVAIRTLVRHRFFSILNILGLALGMACSLLILLWVNDEKSVDAFHAHGNRLFTVYQRQFFENKAEGLYATTGHLAEELKRVVPEVEYSAQLRPAGLNTFRAGDKIQKEEGGYAGADFFSMFSYPLLEGKAQTALSTPESIAISRKMARDFYGSPQNAMGKAIRFENKKEFHITAVFGDQPGNVSEKFDYLIDFPTFLADNHWAGQWGNYGNYTFIQLRTDADPVAVEKKITHFMDHYDAGQSASYKIELGLQPYADVYLHSNFKEGKPAGGRIQYVYLFSIVAAFILLIACINFMNLTTARSLQRAREIGIRKVIGALRSALIAQFIGEALLLAFIAAGIALVLVLSVLPLFNQLTGKEIELPFHQPAFWACLAGLTLVTGIISGSYPALFLSSFQPIRVLKGSMKFGAGALWFRKGLVVFQFVLSIVLIIATLVVSRQIQFIQSRNLGYDRENLVYVPMDGDLSKKYEAFKMEAAKIPGIKSISRISAAPTSIGDQTFMVDWPGKDPHLTSSWIDASVGYNFVQMMKLQMVQGREFSKDFGGDSAGYLINEAALKKIGYKNPIGQPLTFWGNKGVIIGVVKDFHFNSMHEVIQPLVLRLGEHENRGVLLLRVEAGKTKETLAGLETLCKQFNPEFPFTYSFADEEFRKLYKSEEMVGSLSNCFAFLAIFICCLGLLGLALFTAEQRNKEIGIRKVLGASVPSLLALLSREFLGLVLLALLFAIPLAGWAMTWWLRDFAYHIPLSAGMFITAGVLAIFIAVATVSFHALKAALANPVRSLRSE